MICLYCHESMDDHIDIFTLFKRNRVVCMNCESKLRPNGDVNRCTRCHNILPESIETCDSCHLLRKMFVHTPHNIFSALDYNKEVQQLFHRYKFVNDAALSGVIAHFIGVNFKKYDLVVPVPISKARLKERTYNQVSLVLNQLNVQYHDILLTDKTKRQSELSKAQRLKQSDVFKVKESMIEIINGANILLVDDIYTTGITAHHAVQELCKYNCKTIDVLTFSRS